MASQKTMDLMQMRRELLNGQERVLYRGRKPYRNLARADKHEAWVRRRERREMTEGQ